MSNLPWGKENLSLNNVADCFSRGKIRRAWRFFVTPQQMQMRGFDLAACCSRPL
jgi:hypothetical protein